jgi:uncharacterized protein (TIGR03435 family)
MRGFAKILAALIAVSATAQPSFEVASIKVNTIDGPSDRVPLRSGDRVTMRNVTVDSIVRYAYRITGVGQLSGNLTLPGSEASQWFDIAAIAPGSPSDDELRLIFRSLLEDRFQLKVHYETREMTGYDLLVAKGGAKLLASSPDSKAASVLRSPGALVLSGKEHARFLGKAATIAEVAGIIASAMRAPVRDRTGLTGTFDIDFPFSLNDTQLEAGGAPFLSTAIQDELGLRLEKNKTTLDVLVIDHVERPTAN